MSRFFFDHDIINNTIKGYLEDNLKQIGDIKYVYLILNKKKPSDVAIIHNYPEESIQQYLENSYQNIDPVVITAFDKIAPFSWEKNMVLSPIHHNSRKYDISNGCCFVLHDQENKLVLLSLAMVGDGIQPTQERIEMHAPFLQMLLIKAHDKLSELYREENANRCQPAYEKDMFSQRENEILYWASMGKTYQEIALILGIKTVTVKFHMGNVVKKLGVLNAKHAIRIGIEMKLIKPAI